MFLENLGIDALDPKRLGRFWETALGTTTLTDAPDILAAQARVERLLGRAAQVIGAEADGEEQVA